MRPHGHSSASSPSAPSRALPATARALPVCLLLACLCVSGCASPRAEYDAALKTWMGQPAAAFIAKWGPPSKTVERIKGFKELVYERSAIMTERERTRTTTRTEQEPYPLYVKPGEVYIQKERTIVETTVTPAYSSEIWCKTRLLVNPDGILVLYTFEGNSCLAPK